MIGIYKITSKISKRSYIGQSVTTDLRIKAHFRNAYNENTHTYDYPLSRAIRKYGKENFEYEILEEVSEDRLTEREQYWIDYYDTINNGYNQIPAEDGKRYEHSNFAILTMKEVEEITELLKNTSITMKDIAAQYGVVGSAIEDINKGKNWAREIDYPIRKNAQSVAKRGEKHTRSVLTEDQVMEIRRRYVNETLPEIYEDYKDITTFGNVKKICYGGAWMHLPIYKKRLKKWVYPE